MAQRFIEPIARIFTNAGAVGVGYKYYFYATGTTTPVTTYQNAGLTVANTNPVLSDANGRFPEIWYSDLSQLKLVVKDSSGNTIETVDPVGASSSAVSLNDFDIRPTSYWGLTAGTSTAYTLVANPTISAYDNTQTFLIQFHVSCGATPTLAIDGLSALNLKKYNSTGVKESLIAGDVQASTRYLAINDGVDIVILDPEYPNKYYANSTTKRGFTYFPSQITISYSSATAVSFSAGTFIFSDGSGQAVAAAMTKTIQSSGSWAAGTGQNGLDTGAKANSTWYHCYAICNITDLTTPISDFIFSTSASSPTLPSGYTKYKRVGSVRTDSSGNIQNFIQTGNYFYRKEASLMYNGNATTSAASVTLETPLGIVTTAILSGSMDSANDSTSYYLRVFGGDGTDAAATSNNYSVRVQSGSGSAAIYPWSGLVATNTSSQIYHRASATRAIQIVLHGWIDNSLFL